ncbi:pickpocket protein 28-like [Anopheles cruzii]|uniref:pickpocket protein 28-like n=1 Tax=Anopheles cruzii TaxID=68878 RepID=UPI0022EC86A9|nr:pickpocket protein 28-like [Anopheles cruzii]
MTKPARRKACKPVKSEVFREYCASSSVHGVRYFDSHERTTCERFWWLVVFLLSMGGCGTLIHKTFSKWEEAPIIVTFSEKTTPVWEVPFPAITICPEAKVQAKKLNFTGQMSALLEDLRDNGPNMTMDPAIIGQLKVVAQLCNFLFHSQHYYLPSLNGTDEDDIVSMLKNISLNRHRVKAFCMFDNFHYECNDYLKETITEEGICYSFNMRPEDGIFRPGAVHDEFSYTEDWLGPNNSSTRHAPDPSPPIHASGAGLNSGLLLYLQQNLSDIDYMCTGFSQGYKLMLHDADEYPQVSKRNIRVPLGHEINMALKPQMIITSQSAAAYGWQKRQCFFNYERHLRFFRNYNQNNCELECLTNLTLALCGCVRFSMPHAQGTQICPLLQWDCMFQAKQFFRPKSNVSHEFPRSVQDTVARCNCLPACTSIHYDLEITQSSLDIERFFKANGLQKNYIYHHFAFTSLEIYFKESHFITSKRTELYGIVDLLANCGGLLGLFMGVSFLSLIEICYFITIRPFSIRKTRSDRKPPMAGQNDANNSLLAVVSKTD